MRTLPHFLRAVRSLALLTGAAAVGCAASVAPFDEDARTLADGAVADRPLLLDAVGPDGQPPPPDDARTTTDVARADATAHPCDNPGPEGAPCDAEVQCGTGCGSWRCYLSPNARNGTWMRLECGGPLDPPDLPRA